MNVLNVETNKTILKKTARNERRFNEKSDVEQKNDVRKNRDDEKKSDVDEKNDV